MDKALVNDITKDMVEKTIGTNSYQHNKVDQWTTSICEGVISALVKRDWPYKFIATCTVVQKNGAGFHSSTNCYWDSASDTCCTVRWENKSMHTIVQIFAVAL